MTKNIGYTTMTGDLLHEGHINFLKTAKSLCDILIVGVTTDELAIKQKRKTWFPFSQRRAVISSLECVDIVVEHNGQSKYDAHAMLHFTSLFIGDDYVGADEYSNFQLLYPDISVSYIPRTSGVSSSYLISRFEDRVIEGMDVLAHGIGGQVLRFQLDKSQIIVKAVLLGYRESRYTNGQDAYNIGYPTPRNWKVGKIVENKYPMISGVNGYREIKVHELIGKYKWNPFIKEKLVHASTNPCIADAKMSNIDAIQYERKYPTKTYWLYQRNCGKTLAQHMRDMAIENPPSTCKAEFRNICEIIKQQITELNSIGIINGDLHPNNICIDSDGIVSFIDFGWCLSKSFELQEEEKKYLQRCLNENFDWVHFSDSLYSFGIHEYLVEKEASNI